MKPELKKLLILNLLSLGGGFFQRERVCKIFD